MPRRKKQVKEEMTTKEKLYRLIGYFVVIVAFFLYIIVQSNLNQGYFSIFNYILTGK